MASVDSCWVMNEVMIRKRAGNVMNILMGCFTGIVLMTIKTLAI